MKNIKKLISAAAALLLLTSCGGTAEKSGKPQVYTSFYAMYDFTRTVGGEDIDLYNIVPAGTEPHDFEPTAADMARLNEADVFIYNGNGIDEWARDISATLPDTVNCMSTSAVLSSYREGDPHVWLSFVNAKIQMKVICDTLSAVDSAHADSYTARTHSYFEQIDALYEEYESAGLAGKKLFVTHGAYAYLCDEFGMEQSALEGIAGESDPSPARMAQFVDEMRAADAKCIFYDPLEGDKTAKAVAAEAGVEALPLYTFEGDSEDRDYVTVMRLNLEQLKKSL